jgi:hypothetical protein
MTEHEARTEWVAWADDELDGDQMARAMVRVLREHGQIAYDNGQVIEVGEWGDSEYTEFNPETQSLAKVYAWLGY